MSQNSLGLESITIGEICKMLKSTDKTNATNLDNIPVRVERGAAEYIAPFSTHIINIPLIHSQVPSNMKMAKVTPRHKKGSKTKVGNYRSALIFNTIIKVLERVVNNQLHQYIQNNHLLF